MPLIHRALVLAAVASAAVLAACASSPPAATNLQAAPPIPMRDFFRNIDRGYYRLSSDGRQLSYMQPAIGDDGKSRRMNIFVQALDGSRPVGEVRRPCRGGRCGQRQGHRPDAARWRARVDRRSAGR
jgi:hypothetical protein